MSQINVTPLVDVMLVLLIIFMVAAPMMQSGIEVDLPKIEASAITSHDEPIVISIDRRLRIYMGKKRVKQRDLKKKLAAIQKTRGEISVLLKADEKVSYGTVVRTMAEIRKGGVTKIGMVTEPINIR
ncbi:MAG: protein TolR [Proteobacteria bacterium]|nr:protein TolR [Pseudomonadota bacterium]